MEIGGKFVRDPTMVRRGTSFIGSIEDMHFGSYYDRYFTLIQEWLQNQQKPLLTTIRSICYADRLHPTRTLTMWIAYSDDRSVGWYKYEGLVGGGTYHKLIYNGQYHRVPYRCKRTL